MALTLLLFISAAALQFATNVSPVPVQQLPMYIISQDDGDATSTCPKEKAVATRQKIATAIRDILQQFIVPRRQCGDGQWYRVAYLNMSDPSQQCPSVWREYTSDGIRLCAQPTSSRGRCPGTLYPVSRQYGRVCGRVIGYQFGSTDAFHSRSSNIDQAYVDGISITHGRPRNHIWTYAAASSSKKSCSSRTCPCSSSNSALPPLFVGSNYYCESAHDGGGNCFVNNVFFPNDPLWDGQQCDNEGTCCTGANTPPWFSVKLPDSASDDIEVRICRDEGTTNEDSPIQLLELYVQ